MNVGIIDYGASNLHSVSSALIYLGKTPKILNLSSDFSGVDALVLPGVGDFAYAANALETSDCSTKIREFAIQGKLVLGICLGMQLLFDSSSENGFNKGLGLISGRVVHISKISKNTNEYRIPRMGWFSVYSESINNFKSEIGDMYFAHSYNVAEVPEEFISLRSNLGETSICVGTVKESVFGVQFHPEKSGIKGLKWLNEIFKQF